MESKAIKWKDERAVRQDIGVVRQDIGVVRQDIGVVRQALLPGRSSRSMLREA